MAKVITQLSITQIANMTPTERVEITLSIEREFENAPEFFYKSERAENLRNLLALIERLA